MSIASLDEALFQQAISKIAGKAAGNGKLALELGDYEVHATIAGRVKRAGGRWHKDIERIIQASVHVLPARDVSVSPRSAEIIAALLASGLGSARQWASLLATYDYGGLTRTQLAEAQIVLNATKTTRRGQGARVEVSGSMEPVES